LAWGSVLLIPTAAICIADGLRQVGAFLAPRRGPIGSMLVGATPALGFLATAATAASLYASLAPDRELYRTGVPLPLPGAIRLRVPPPQATALVWLRNEILDHCTSFVTFPGLPSLHFWTGIAPPNGFNVGTWMYLFDPEIQRGILKRIRGVER